MVQGLESELKDIVLSNSSFGPNEIEHLSRAITADYSQFRVLRDLVGELESQESRSPAMSARLGVCYYLLGRFKIAAETLRKADAGAVAYFYLGKSLSALMQHADAVESYQMAKNAGYDADQCALAIAEAKRYGGDAQGALTTLDQLSGPVEQSAEYLYQRGATVAAMGGNPNEVVALYERAVETNRYHVGALFGLALESDRRGNDDKAIELYKRSAGSFPSHVGALLNLGVLYEDLERYDLACECYHRILDSYPTEPRARLFLKDASASGDMFFDEEAQKRRDRLTQVLNISVTDFELSVRSRNCLQKMGIQTLGDLTRTTEQQLLASKNFGETSLVEIREMLVSKGLELGQFADQGVETDQPLDYSLLTPDEQALMERPISELNLSVRARKCMVRLGLNTVGELIRKTGDDLLECKNFGVTSLNEVREKLTQFGLKLRGD